MAFWWGLWGQLVLQYRGLAPSCTCAHTLLSPLAVHSLCCAQGLQGGVTVGKGKLRTQLFKHKLACDKWRRLVIGLCCAWRQLLIIQPGSSQRPTILPLSNMFYSTHTLGETHRPCSCITITMLLSNNLGCQCTPGPPHSMPPYLQHQVESCQTLGTQYLAPMAMLTMMPAPIALAKTTVQSIATHSS